MANYSIRYLDPMRGADVESVNTIHAHPLVQSQMDSDEGGEDDASFWRSHKNMLYGVVDHNDVVIGWVWFYQDKDHPLPEPASKAFGIKTESDLIVQVSYERMMSGGWSEDLISKLKCLDRKTLFTPRKGVIMYGLKESIKQLQMSTSRRLVVYGFTDSKNVASERVLEKTGFTQYLEQFPYDNEMLNLWVKIGD